MVKWWLQFTIAFDKFDKLDVYISADAQIEIWGHIQGGNMVTLRLPSFLCQKSNQT